MIKILSQHPGRCQALFYCMQVTPLWDFTSHKGHNNPTIHPLIHPLLTGLNSQNKSAKVFSSRFQFSALLLVGGVCARVCLFDPEVFGVAAVISHVFVADVHSHLLGGPCLLTSETEAETSSSSSLHVRPPRPPGPPLITSHRLKSGHSVRLYQVNHSERGRENLLRLFPDQSKPIPAFSLLVWDERMKLDCLPSGPVL